VLIGIITFVVTSLLWHRFYKRQQRVIAYLEDWLEVYNKAFTELECQKCKAAYNRIERERKAATSQQIK
jgi:hypothetical protein